MSPAKDDEVKKTLISNVKREVKKIMEEAVTRKFVHEESSSITSLCGAVEACLSHGLRRRALGLFKSGSTTALLHKVAKNFEPAAEVARALQELESDTGRRSSSSGDSTSRPLKPPLQKRASSNATGAGSGGAGGAGGASGASGAGGTGSGGGAQPAAPKYLWIRLALFDKKLTLIIDHLAQNASKYYEKDALVSDPDYGSILSSLLVGPCALDFSKTKTQDHFWTDPPADELVQRHRISQGHGTPPQRRRPPALNFRRSLGEERVPPAARDYVESLHQNSRATLLYGKNNVLVLPKDMTEPMPGYLSLHQAARSLTIKWTPNQLMNGYSEPNDVQDKSIYWDYALNVRVDEIVYVHCHQQADSGGTIVLVGQDGVQRPPIHFPKGGHLLSFLSCLETGLLPHGQLDPPLWSQRGRGNVFAPHRRVGKPMADVYKSDTPVEATDYVFRIVSKTHHEDYCAELLDMQTPVRPPPPPQPHAHPRLPALPLAAAGGSETLDDDAAPDPTPHPPPPKSAPPAPPAVIHGDPLQEVCRTMRRQIISRAFYGWLAYCRHLRTVRTHLAGLVHEAIVASQGLALADASQGLSAERWQRMHEESGGRVTDAHEVFRLAYFGGVAPDIRKEAWPYLLGHYQFGSTPEERQALDRETHHGYETTMSEWLAVEAIVRQRDKEAMAANLAKLSSESTSGDVPPTPALQQDLSNDVFEDNLSSLSDEDVVEGEEGRERPRGPPNSVDSMSREEELQNLRNHREESGALSPARSVSVSSAQSGGQPVVRGSHPKSTPTINGHSHLDKNKRSTSPDEGVVEDAVTDSPTSQNFDDSSAKTRGQSKSSESSEALSTVIVTTNPSVDSGHQSEPCTEDNIGERQLTPPAEEKEGHDTLGIAETEGEGASAGSRSTCISPASSQGGVYPNELLDTFGLNLHRIDKDVQRCDRNYWYFTPPENLDKLRNVMCTYVWEHLDIGYMQGMCDLVAPLLVIFDDEGLTYSCFCRLMERMGANFPNGGAMDAHFANMRSLIQILDAEMYELMHQNGDYTHFYFCYRWFLLDFKRELLYDDVFSVWETIWAAKHVASSHFVLFIALALVECYRDIILSNSMDFTDIIKFFNEMAERHDAKAVLSLARDLVLQLQMVIENK
ncbi:hypothetical protein R5R35_005950 [Gryllus longicercus]|uniref:Small G protein signaling modulator 1 n=1 Tax=Gryllus longicercus TaxID=2509291 RepID=A0AAN9V929_9ORTH